MLLFFVFSETEGDEIPWTHSDVSEANKATMAVIIRRRIAMLYCFVFMVALCYTFANEQRI